MTVPGQPATPANLVGGGGTTDPRGAPLVDTQGGGASFGTLPGNAASGPGIPGATSAGPPLGAGVGDPAATGTPATPAEVARQVIRMRAMESVGGNPYTAAAPVEFYMPPGVPGGAFNRTAAVVLNARPQDLQRPNGFYDYDPNGNEVPATLTPIELVAGGNAHVVQANNPSPQLQESAVPG